MLRALLLLASLLAAAPATATEAAWALLRDGGHVVLLRHANAPGTGDPANFDIDDCSTQRNLSDRGEQQARKIGALFAARAAPVEQVLSSRWCRALDTARLAFGERLTKVFEPLDSFFENSDKEAGQSAAVVEAVKAFTGSGNMVMVTHQVNITALTGIVPREGEAVIVATEADEEGEGLRILGRIIFN